MNLLFEIEIEVSPNELLFPLKDSCPSVLKASDPGLIFSGTGKADDERSRHRPESGIPGWGPLVWVDSIWQDGY